MINLLFRADLDGKGVYSGLAGIRNAAKGVGASIGGTLKGGVAGALGIGAIGASIANAVAQGGKLNDMSAALGHTKGFLQEAGYAAAQFGSNLDEVAGASQRLIQAQRAALAGGEQQTAAFAGLGISIADLKTLNPDELFRRTAKAMDGAAGTSNQLADAITLMGRGATNVLSMMRGGFEEASAKARELVVVNDETIESLDGIGDKVDSIKGMWQSLWMTITAGAVNAASGIKTFIEKAGAGAYGLIQGGVQAVGEGRGINQVIDRSIDTMKLQIQGIDAEKEAARVIAKAAADKKAKTLEDNIPEEVEVAKKTRTSPAGSGGSPQSNADAFAKIGLFVGGTSGGFLQLQKDQLLELRNTVAAIKEMQAYMNRVW